MISEALRVVVLRGANFRHYAWFARRCYRFRVPYMPFCDDTQTVFPDIRRDARQGSTTSGDVSHVCKLPPGMDDVACPSERPTNTGACYGTDASNYSEASLSKISVPLAQSFEKKLQV